MSAASLILLSKKLEFLIILIILECELQPINGETFLQNLFQASLKERTYNYKNFIAGSVKLQTSIEENFKAVLWNEKSFLYLLSIKKVL